LVVFGLEEKLARVVRAESGELDELSAGGYAADAGLGGLDVG
jgi:hypothetical protein